MNAAGSCTPAPRRGAAILPQAWRDLAQGPRAMRDAAAPFWAEQQPRAWGEAVRGLEGALVRRCLTAMVPAPAREEGSDVLAL